MRSGFIHIAVALSVAALTAVAFVALPRAEMVEQRDDPPRHEKQEDHTPDCGAG